MAKYDLTGSLETSFTFTIEGKEYSFRKPTVREMRALAKTFSEVDKEEDEDKKLDKSDEAMAGLYKYVSPVNHETDIAEVMDKQPVDVQINFNNMIQKEFGLSQ